jgi:long-chain acyl-CoA synthetase
MYTIPQRILGEALLQSAYEHPDKTAVLIKDLSYSYRQLNTQARAMAAHLNNSGITRGDRVAIYMNNTWACIVSIYGTTMAGAAFLIINPQTKPDKLLYILNDSGAKLLVSEHQLRKDFSKILHDSPHLREVIVTEQPDNMDSIPNIRMTGFEKIIADNSGHLSQLPIVIPNDLAALIYTSGSTGFPKGVMMTHQSMVFTSWSLIQYLRLRDRDRIIVLSPFAFDYGLYQLLMAITIGGTIIVEQSFTFQKTIYNLIDQHQPTVFPGVPTIYAMMIAAYKKAPFSLNCIEKITNTAAALPVEFIPDLKRIFPNALIFKMYGLTECKRVCYLEPELIDTKPGSVGKAIPGTEVFLLSEEGQPVGPRQKGLLHIRGPHVMLGYWNQEALSKAMLKPGSLPGEKVLCSNDWFKTDEEGFLYFLGRNDDIIKTRGEKVSPLEIENVIYTINGIKEVAVLGVPDVLMGASIWAFITHNGLTMNEKLIQRTCAAKLEAFMVPQRVIFVDDMPKSTNGKIDKKELRKLYLTNES